MRDLLERLSDPEDSFVERKSDGIKPSDIRRTLVGFANSVPQGREAILFIGVRDDGEIEGCKNPDSKQKDVRRTCDFDCYPPLITASCEILNVGNKSVVAVVVTASSNRPHFAGHAYVRRGSETIAASPQLFDEMVHSRNSLVHAILRHRNEVFTVESVGHVLGNTKSVPRDTRQRYECKLLDCNPQFLRLQNISSIANYSEPMSQVELLRDEERHRPKLVIRGPA